MKKQQLTFERLEEIEALKERYHQYLKQMKEAAKAFGFEFRCAGDIQARSITVTDAIVAEEFRIIMIKDSCGKAERYLNLLHGIGIDIREEAKKLATLENELIKNAKQRGNA